MSGGCEWPLCVPEGIGQTCLTELDGTVRNELCTLRTRLVPCEETAECVAGCAFLGVTVCAANAVYRTSSMVPVGACVCYLVCE